MQPIYATPQDFKNSVFSTDDDGSALVATQATMYRASIAVDSYLKNARYEVDPDTQCPADENVLAAVRDATCAQAAWFLITGDMSGAQDSLPPVTLGPLTLGGTSRASSAPQQTTDPRVSLEAVMILQNANLMTAW